jgi:hypothetical protein
MYSAALARLLQNANPAKATTITTPSAMTSLVFLPRFKLFSLDKGFKLDKFIAFLAAISGVFLTVEIGQITTHNELDTGGRRAVTEEIQISDLRSHISD